MEANIDPKSGTTRFNWYRNKCIALCIIISLFTGPITARAEQPSDFLVRTHTISLEVACLDEALRRLGNMPGIVLNSSIHMQAEWGTMDRRVANHELEHSLAELHSMGRVVSMESHSTNVFAMFTDLRSEFEVRSDEYDRLMELLYAVDSIDNFTHVENRLVNVISEMEFLQGRLNHFDFETGTTRLHIDIRATDPDREIIEPISAFSRIGTAFVDSAGFTLSFVQWALIIFMYISVPLMAFAVMGFSIVFLFRKYQKRAKKAGESLQDEKDEKID